MQTSRQQILNILRRQPLDRPAWTTLVDDTTRSLMPEEIRRLPVFDFYRHIRCAILQFGCYGLPPDLCVPSPARRDTPDLKESWDTLPTGQTLHTRTLHHRSLTAHIENGHPVQYPVQSREDIHTLIDIWSATQYLPDPAHAPALARTEAALGDSGVFLPTTEPSPVQTLLEYEMGAEGFYFLLQDYPEDFRQLLAVMHDRRCQEYQLLAANTPAEAVIPVENTSSTLISPQVYRDLSLPQLRDYIAILHAHHKKAILHMCGHLLALLPAIRETNLDGINAVTPPPVGTTTFENVWDLFGDDFAILGGMADATLLHNPRTTPQQLHDYLTHLYTPRVRRANLLLWLGVDGLPTPLDRFLTVRDWFTRHRA